MEHKNIFDALKEKSLSVMDTKLAIAMAMTADKELNEFVIKNAYALVAIKENDFEPSEERVVVAMDACITSMAQCLEGASGAYEDYRERGDIAIVEGLKVAVLMSAFRSGGFVGVPSFGKTN
jgi:hypothetical protein